MLLSNPDEYEFNGYMNGLCKKCGEWEAPITSSELNQMVDTYAHHGTGEKKADKKVNYFREYWNEYFQCPKCSNRFYVKYSST